MRSGATAAGRGSIWNIPAMPHGYPVAATAAPSSAMLPVGICATHWIARFWGLGASA